MTATAAAAAAAAAVTGSGLIPSAGMKKEWLHDMLRIDNDDDDDFLPLPPHPVVAMQLTVAKSYLEDM